MNYEQVKDLIKTIEGSSLTEFELMLDNANIKMRKTHTGQTPVWMQSGGSHHVTLPAGEATTEQAAAKVSEIIQQMEEPITIVPPEKPTVALEGELIKAPLVGTFYSRPGPDKPFFVKVGDKVKTGDILCIVEAMKIMNEITSTINGTVAEILAENESMVEYHQPLFRIVKG